MAGTGYLTNKSAIWGVYPGWKPADFSDFEVKVGGKIDLAGVFVHWGNENQFPQEMATWTKNTNKILVIYWEAMDYNTSTTEDPRFSYKQIINGKWDTYIKSFADSAKEFGGSVILIPFSEANGDWNTWSGTKNGNSPALHIEAYRHIRKLFAGVNNVKFGWAVNNYSIPDIPENAIDKYYPGDDYVDYVGVDGFNFGNPWQSFDEVFGKTLAELKKYNKPVYIFSMACAQGSKKADWIEDAMVKIQKSKIAGWIWFNENKERDWRVWSDEKSFKAFAAGLD